MKLCEPPCSMHIMHISCAIRVGAMWTSAKTADPSNHQEARQKSVPARTCIKGGCPDSVVHDAHTSAASNAHDLCSHVLRDARASEGGLNASGSTITGSGQNVPTANAHAPIHRLACPRHSIITGTAIACTYTGRWCLLMRTAGSGRPAGAGIGQRLGSQHALPHVGSMAACMQCTHT